MAVQRVDDVVDQVVDVLEVDDVLGHVEVRRLVAEQAAQQRGAEGPAERHRQVSGVADVAAMTLDGLDDLRQRPALVLQDLDQEAGPLLVDPGPDRGDHLLLAEVAGGDLERLLADGRQVLQLRLAQRNVVAGPLGGAAVDRGDLAQQRLRLRRRPTARGG